jgi:hypothetical protein
MLVTLKKYINDTCEGCVYGKAHTLNFGIRKHATAASSQLIHADECCPLELPSARSYRYFVLLKEDTTQGIAIYTS